MFVVLDGVVTTRVIVEDGEDVTDLVAISENAEIEVGVEEEGEGVVDLVATSENAEIEAGRELLVGDDSYIRD
jgi:hypothetical protein